MAPDRHDDRPLRIALLSYRGKPHVGGQGVYTRHLTQGARRPRPPRRGPLRPALPGARRRVPLVELPSLDIYNDHFPMRMPGSGSSSDWTDLVEVAVVLAGHVPRAAGVLAAGLGPPARRGGTTSTSCTTTSASATACSPSSGSACRCSPPSTTRSPSTAASSWSTPRRPAGGSTLRRWYAFTRMQTRVARRLHADHHGVASRPGRHRAGPRRRRPTGCTSCRSASTPTCFRPIPTA